ncbi:hypothetical protein P7H71_04730 [Lactococcus lactis]|jgi:hypothetical protein|uniref:Prophage protein n=1 Tax=Lactococcus lactis TaxID=1358 RepID=A0AAW8UEX7_9LACT|nr:hypothetical protein [Lactococcus lactis]MDT2861427.1 hypothetical protein [Lactococcus lactis]MDT2870561.1 hypothetical protein [Lactococcus lactis]MDT2872149.1 hypothetical protein [Lactococcus lactis]MDT2876616.1 hypothetical protein [Lactococcus lactis]MDT2881845.1 hypothetical protein [Lactococcus lactis]
MSIIKLHEQEENNEPKEFNNTIKRVLMNAKEAVFERQGSIDDLADTLAVELDVLAYLLDIPEIGFSPSIVDKELALKAQIQELYSLNDSMVTSDPNHIPRYTDGTIITLSDLVDMNVQALDNIAELIGFELEE